MRAAVRLVWALDVRRLVVQDRLPPSAYTGTAILGLSVAPATSIHPTNRAARRDVVAALHCEQFHRFPQKEVA